MSSLLENEILKLRPAGLADKRKIFNWLSHSNLTAEMLGLPLFPDSPAPNWEEFDEDYASHYFEDTQPEKGRCFVIEKAGKEIGQINYNSIDSETRSTEIDIWLADREFTGQRFGTEAIRLLSNYLHHPLGCQMIYVAPSRRNANAIKAFKKAGFTETKILPDNFIPDYSDSLLMLKTFLH